MKGAGSAHRAAGYDRADVVKALRGMNVTVHVAQRKKGSAIDGRTTRHAGYATSPRLIDLYRDPFGVTGSDVTITWP